MPSSWAAADQQEEARDPCGWCVEPGPLPGAPLTSCLPVGPHGCGLVLRTAEPQPSLLGRLGKPGGRREEDERLGRLQPPREPASWTRAPPARIAGTWATCAPGPVSLPLSLPVPWVTFSVPSCLHFSLYRLFSVSVRLCSARVSPRAHFSFPSSALPPAALSQVTKSYMSQKRKKEKKSKHKKAKQKQTSSVAKRGVLPVARSPPARLRVSRPPARLPSC